MLQTDTIAGNKSKYWQWNALHAFLVTLCIFALAIPFGALTLSLVLLNGVAHFFLDYYKPVIVRLLKLPDLIGFLVDQLLHISLLFLISLTGIPDSESFMLQDLHVVKLLVVIVLVTSFAAVLNQYILMVAFPRTGRKFFEQGEKQTGIFTRLSITIAVYFSIVVSAWFILLLPITALALVFAHRSGLSPGIGPKQLAFKITLDVIASAAGVGLLFWA